jgi:hypothetical protein
MNHPGISKVMFPSDICIILYKLKLDGFSTSQIMVRPPPPKTSDFLWYSFTASPFHFKLGLQWLSYLLTLWFIPSLRRESFLCFSCLYHPDGYWFQMNFIWIHHIPLLDVMQLPLELAPVIRAVLISTFQQHWFPSMVGVVSLVTVG